MNFARLNHILLPSTRDARDRLRQSWRWRLVTPVAWFYAVLSDEGRALAIVTLFVGTAGVQVGTTQVFVLWAGLIGLFCGSMLVRPAFGLRRVTLRVSAPPRVAAGAPMRLTLTLDNPTDTPHDAIRLRGPFLPWDGKYVTKPPRFGRLEAGGQVRDDVEATFIQRGHHHLDPFFASCLLPFGLIQGPTIASDGCKFLVVPRLARVTRLTLPEAATSRSGHRGRPQTRRDRPADASELVGVRPYRRGDPVRDLHVRTWARTGTPHVRQYQPLRQRRVMLLVDTAVPGAGERALEAAISLAAGVAEHLVRTQLDRVVVGDEIHRLPPGRAGLDRTLDLLATAEIHRAERDPLDLVVDPVAAVIVTPSVEGRALAWLTSLEGRGVPVRLLRVAAAPWWSRTPPPPARHPRERVVEAVDIEKGRWLTL
ncbi:MAG: DUF58 domain-containing protein [Myxococcota bacterium]